MAYDKTNSGTIAKNTRKTQDNHPDITGSINVDGADYWINGWLKENKSDGGKFYSLAVKPKQPRQEAPARTMPADKASRRVPVDPSFADPYADDDNIPF